jgi:CDK inhibitor PHO81
MYFFFLSFFKLNWSLLLRYNNQVKVPSLVRAVRDAGLLIAAYDTAENLANLVSSTQSIDGGGVDAVFQEGVLVFHDHFPRAWS